MKAVFGAVDEPLVRLLDRVQARYFGLRYQSLLFDATVTFMPMCEPEEGEEAPEILYAIETGSIVGASLSATGEVNVGLDDAEPAVFPGLDSVTSVTHCSPSP